VDVSCTDNDGEHGPRVGHGGFGALQPDMPMTLEQWLADAPTLDTGFDPAVHAYRRALLDLAALRFRSFRGLEWSLPAAGAPWFMALFGRDSLITAYQALPFQPRLARTTLEALAALQATGVDDFRDAQPGKILHELRRGELTVSGRAPHSPYYGSHDATPRRRSPPARSRGTPTTPGGVPPDWPAPSGTTTILPFGWSTTRRSAGPDQRRLLEPIARAFRAGPRRRQAAGRRGDLQRRAPVVERHRRRGPRRADCRAAGHPADEHRVGGAHDVQC
jgi:hypothetical protein